MIKPTMEHKLVMNMCAYMILWLCSLSKGGERVKIQWSRCSYLAISEFFIKNLRLQIPYMTLNPSYHCFPPFHF